jgi:hypothetical protein
MFSLQKWMKTAHRINLPSESCFSSTSRVVFAQILKGIRYENVKSTCHISFSCDNIQKRSFTNSRVLSVVFINLGALSWMDVSIYQDSWRLIHSLPAFLSGPYKQWRILEGTGEGNSPPRFWENYILVHALLKVTNFILNVKQIRLISCVLVNSKIVYWSLIFMNNIYVYLWNTYDERKWLF